MSRWKNWASGAVWALGWEFILSVSVCVLYSYTRIHARTHTHSNILVTAGRTMAARSRITCVSKVSSSSQRQSPWFEPVHTASDLQWLFLQGIQSLIEAGRSVDGSATVRSTSNTTSQPLLHSNASSLVGRSSPLRLDDPRAYAGDRAESG
jgi:hypothetical protein